MNKGKLIKERLTFLLVDGPSEGNGKNLLFSLDIIYNTYFVLAPQNHDTT